MIRNYDENALLESSGIALLLNLILSVNKEGERGDANAMANRVILHLLGYNCNLYTGIGDPYWKPFRRIISRRTHISKSSGKSN